MRDTQGRYGLIDEFCAHRGVSLWFGRNEENGLRCPYHGWKYDVTGQCIEVPSEPVESGFCKQDQAQVLSADRARRRAVDLHGPAGEAAAAAGIRVRHGAAGADATSPSGCRNATGCRRWKAASIPATSPGCTAANSSSDPLFKGAKGNEYNLGDVQPHFEVVESPGGLLIGARRNAENGNYYWRITQWVMPCFTMIPPRGDHPVHGHFWIPIDDENCWAWSFDYHPTRPLTPMRSHGDARRQGHPRQVRARHLPAARQQGQRLPDRPRGAEGRHAPTAASQASPCRTRRCRKAWGRSSIAPRRTSSRRDNGIIMARHRLMRAAKALVEKDVTPPGVDIAHQRVRSASIVLSPDQSFKDAARDALLIRPGIAHTSV